MTGLKGVEILQSRRVAVHGMHQARYGKTGKYMQTAARLLLLYYGVDRGVARIMLEAGVTGEGQVYLGEGSTQRLCPSQKSVFFSVKLTRFVALLYTNGFQFQRLQKF